MKIIDKIIFWLVVGYMYLNAVLFAVVFPWSLWTSGVRWWLGLLLTASSLALAGGAAWGANVIRTDPTMGWTK